MSVGDNRNEMRNESETHHKCGTHNKSVVRASVITKVGRITVL